MKVWNNGEFTDEADKAMIITAWILSWAGMVIGAII